MLIDWFTVIAQIINFLVLVWLLKRFLYKPILGAIDAREKRIVAQLADAAALKSEAQKQLDDFHRQSETFANQRDALLSQATTEAHAERQRLLEEVRKEADILRSRREEALKSEQRRLNGEIIRRTQQEVLAIAKKALSDLAGADLDERMSEVLIRRLHELNIQERTLIAEDLKSGGAVFVRSAFDLPQSQRATIEATIKQVFSAEAQVQFEIAPDLVGGIELCANGHKVDWNIADYLMSLEKSIGQFPEEATQESQEDHQHAS